MEDKIKHYKLGNTIQEFEEMFGNVPFNDIEKIKKYLLQNYIPKSKIKEKIEEIGKEYAEDEIDCETYSFMKEILQELMEDK